MKHTIFAIVIVLCSTASAQISTEDAQDAVANRRAAYKLISFNFAPMASAIRGDEFDADKVLAGIQRMTVLGEMIPEVFEVDTRGVNGLNTRASDIIWQNKVEFLSMANSLVEGANSAIDILNTQG